jgi:hypothetical protein
MLFNFNTEVAGVQSSISPQVTFTNGGAPRVRATVLCPWRSRMLRRYQPARPSYTPVRRGPLHGQEAVGPRWRAISQLRHLDMGAAAYRNKLMLASVVNAMTSRSNMAWFTRRTTTLPTRAPTSTAGTRAAFNFSESTVRRPSPILNGTLKTLTREEEPGCRAEECELVQPRGQQI